MYDGASVGVVVPAYNEEGLVGDVLETVPGYVDRIYAVDDHSTDETWEEIKETASRMNDTGLEQAPPVADGGLEFDQRVIAIRHEKNRGVGGAVMSGYKRAVRDGLDVVAVMNGDGQMDPDALDRLVEPVASGVADYAKGNRLLYPDYREGMSGWRHFGNSLLTFLTKISSGYWKMMDSQNGYTAISREALVAIGPTEFYGDYGFLNDVLVKLNVHEFTVADVPMQAVYGEETSTIDYRTFVPRLSTLLLRNFLWRLKVEYLVFDFHPLVFFYLVGAVAVAGGALLTVLGIVAGGLGVAVDGVLAGLLGVLAISLAMVFDMHENEPLEVREG